MASSSETGHDKNNANIDKVIDLVTQFGTAYNPTNPQTTLAGLATLKIACNTSQLDLTNAVVPYKNATNTRETNYEPLKKRVTAISDHVKTLSVTQQTIDDVSTLVKRLHNSGGKLTKADAGKIASEENSTNPSEEEGKTISTSYQSYDNLLANFLKLIALIQSIPGYAPNETNIQIATLTTYANSLTADNLAATNATNNYFLKLNTRNLTFYGNQTGLCDIMKKVKLYVRQVFGTQSAQYKQIAAIKFTKYTFKKKAKKKN